MGLVLLKDADVEFFLNYLNYLDDIRKSADATMARDPDSRRGHEIYPDADTDLEHNKSRNGPGQSPVQTDQRIYAY